MTHQIASEYYDELADLKAEVEILRMSNDRLQEIGRLHTSQIVKLEDGLAEVQAFIALMPPPKVREKLKLVEVFPPMESLVQIKGQLFYNPPNTSGKQGGNHPTALVMKLSFWTCANEDRAINKLKNGSVLPFYFPLHGPEAEDTKIKDSNSLLADAVAGLGAELIGCRQIKGKGKQLGSGRRESRYAAILPTGELRMDDIEWEYGSAFVIGDPVDSAPSDDPRHPVKIWTWRRG